ncbi:MAG: serine/threonine protein kinase [Pirellulales bacterium]|nr:serine/threonine protein kinase [Pirellulales bacterium]
MQEQPEDEGEFRALDDYLQRLQAGESPDRRALLEKHPDLASALACLEALDRLAPPAGAVTLLQSGDLQMPAGGPPCDFGAYELLAEVGRGGMGVVYKARQKSLDRLVAVKMILSSHLASADHVRRFQAEAKAAARLSHPNIVHIHEVGQFHGQHYFVMEHVEGMSLAQRLAIAPLDVDSAVRILAKVARAVAHLHRHQIVHRDLKPSNILLDSNDEPYVTDFGLAKVFAPGSEMTATGVIAGTPSYMAPEQAAGRGAEIGPACDIYSLGAILYEMLTGRPPFAEENPLDTLMQVLSREPTLPRRLNSRIPRGLELICLKCLAKSPQDRYPSADELADELDRYCRGEALAVKPPNLIQRLWSWTRREPALASRLAALAVFYVVELVNFVLGAVPASFHAQITAITAAWILSSFALQQCLRFQRWSIPARFFWGVLDSAFLLAALLIADGAASPLVVGYPLLIVGSGLWFRVRFVWFMTALSLASYGVLVVEFYYWSPELQRNFDRAPDRHVVFIVAMLVTAAVVAYLVDRVRALSSYFGQRL